MLNKKSTTTAEAYDNYPTTNSSRPTVGGRGPTQDQIARRAYEIFKSGTGGSPEENWYRAERELRARA